MERIIHVPPAIRGDIEILTAIQKAFFERGYKWADMTQRIYLSRPAYYTLDEADKTIAYMPARGDERPIPTGALIPLDTFCAQEGMTELRNLLWNR